jgi:hypothetical protein
MTVMLCLILQCVMMLRSYIGLLEANNLLCTRRVQTLVQHLALVGKVVSMLLIRVGRQAATHLTLVLSVGNSRVAASVILRTVRPDDSPPRRSRSVVLLVLHLLLGSELLVRRGAETTLTQRQKHLRRSCHTHNDCMVSSA